MFWKNVICVCLIVAFGSAQAEDQIYSLRYCGKTPLCMKGLAPKGLPVKLFNVAESASICSAKTGRSFSFNDYPMGKREEEDEEKDHFDAVEIEGAASCAGWKLRKYTHAVLSSDKAIAVLKGKVSSDKKAISEIDRKIRASELWTPQKKYFENVTFKDLNPTLSELQIIPFQGADVRIATYTEGKSKKKSGLPYLLKVILVDDGIFEFPTKGLVTGPIYFYSVGASNYIFAPTSCKSCDAWQALQTFKVTKDKVELFATDMLYGEAAD